MKFLISLVVPLAPLVVLALIGCDCQKTTSPMDISAAAVASSTTPAGHAALLVLTDSGASQDRKSQATQLLFELERGKRLDDAIARLDELAAKLEVLLERKVESENR